MKVRTRWYAPVQKRFSLGLGYERDVVATGRGGARAEARLDVFGVQSFEDLQ